MFLLSKIYKSHIDSSDLYNQDDHNKNPVAEEIQHKLNMESERLRTRLRQELAELQDRLSTSPAHLSSPLDSIRERLAPLTQQLRSSLSSNTQELCGQLSLYLQGLGRAETQTEASPAIYQEGLQWISQTLEQSSSRLADIISDFHTKTVEVIEHLRKINASEEEATESELWQEISSRLGQEVSSLRVETHNRVGALKTELAALLETSRLQKTELTASMERFCQNARLQSQEFEAQMESMIQGLKKELQGRGASSSSSIQSGGSLQEDFTVQLSALIEDILHSVS